MVRKPAGQQRQISSYLWGPGYDGRNRRVEENGRVILPPLRPGSYTLVISGENTPAEVREFELVVGQQTNLEIDLQPGVVRSVQVEIPEGTLRSRLTFTTFDGAGREVVSWQMPRNPNRSKPFLFLGFRPEAVRLVVISEDGKQPEARLGSSKVIRLVLR